MNVKPLKPPTSTSDERGASATEYGLLAVAVAALIVVIVFALGDVVTDMFNNSCESVASGASTSANCN